MSEQTSGDGEGLASFPDKVETLAEGLKSLIQHGPYVPASYRTLR